MRAQRAARFMLWASGRVLWAVDDLDLDRAWLHTDALTWRIVTDPALAPAPRRHLSLEKLGVGGSVVPYWLLCPVWCPGGVAESYVVLWF